MEMGQPPSVSSADPAVWVNSRQYTGRPVTVTNGVIFKEPVYNYTREFPYIWEEIVVPVTYDADRIRAEQILLSAARTHAVVDDPAADQALATMRSAMPWPTRRSTLLCTGGSPITGSSCRCASSRLAVGSAR